MKLVLVIPARLKSSRLKNKVIIPILSLPMIEHVRRRAILSRSFNKIYVASSDKVILKLIKKNNGNVVKTQNKHISGTSRVGEAIKKIQCTHVAILFADEPLIDPKILSKFSKIISKDKLTDIWNMTTNIKNHNEMKDKSIVKCLVNKKNEIIEFDRFFKDYKKKIANLKILKSVGIFCFKKKILLKLLKIKSNRRERILKIEQIKYLDNKFKIRSINLNFNYFSINNNNELIKCLSLFKKDYYQRKIYKRTTQIFNE